MYNTIFFHIDDVYGIIDNYRKSESSLNGMVVFSCDDIIRRSGHVVELFIQFRELPSSQSNSQPYIFLYVISTTKEKDQFRVIRRHQLSKEQTEQILHSSVENGSYTVGNPHIRRVTISEPTLYVETNQFVGIGFGNHSGEPHRVKGSDSYYVDLNTANNALKTGKPQLFIRQAVYTVTCGFSVRPASSS